MSSVWGVVVDTHVAGLVASVPLNSPAHGFTLPVVIGSDVVCHAEAGR